MTAERYRAPLRQGAQAAGYGHDGHTLADMFGLEPPATPHPDFAERAAIWADHKRGLISFAEARRRSAAVGQVVTTSSSFLTNGPTKRTVRPRHTRPAPPASRQYSGDMSTTAARDDRLTPQAKSFLQVLRARCGKGRETTITKATAGSIMSRSARTIRRYLVDLTRHGYVEVETRADRRGFHLGLVVRLTERALPFYKDAKGLAAWLAETPPALFKPFEAVLSHGRRGVTLLTPINQLSKNLTMAGSSSRPTRQLRRMWRGEVAAPS